MIESIDFIFDNFIPRLWTMVISSWILSYSVLISLLILVIKIHGNKEK